MAERAFTSSSKRTKPTSDDVIGNFVIDKEIGKGSFAQVYSGRHKVSPISAACSRAAPRIRPSHLLGWLLSSMQGWSGFIQRLRFCLPSLPA
jgi:hypothetical protein